MNRPLPPCTGNHEPERCTHFHRVQIALNHGHDVVGGLRTGQCERHALPRLVVCELHAEPEAIRLLVLAMAAEVEKAADLKVFAQRFADMACMGCKQRPSEFRNGRCTSCHARHALGLSSSG